MLQLRLPLPRFVSAGECFSGAGSLGALRALDAAKAIVLASPSVLARHEATLERSIGAEAIRLVAMPRGEPTLAGLQPILAELETFRPDWIIAVGGGSVMDGAKIAWVLYEHPAVERERLLLPFGVPTLRGKARLVAAPTTAGTGAEVSSSALLLDPPTGAKRALTSHELLPDIAVLDPRLAIGCPPDVIAHAGLDALAHAVEGYASRLNNTLADAMAEKSAQMILQTLPAFWHSPDDISLCQTMLEAALMAGWVQNQKIPGLGHAIAHQLASMGIAHGCATGRLLAPSLRYNMGDQSVLERYNQLARTLGLAKASALVERIEALLDELQVASLRDQWGEGADHIVQGAMADPCARVNPREVNAEAVFAVLEDVR